MFDCEENRRLNTVINTLIESYLWTEAEATELTRAHGQEVLRILTEQDRFEAAKFVASHHPQNYLADL